MRKIIFLGTILLNISNVNINEDADFELEPSNMMVWSINQLHSVVHHCIENSPTLSIGSRFAVCFCYFRYIAHQYDYEFYMQHIGYVNGYEMEKRQRCMQLAVPADIEPLSIGGQ